MFKVKNDKKELDTEFWLENRGGIIHLRVKKGGDRKWNVAEISEEGIYLNKNIYQNLDFQKDEKNRIKLVEG